MIFSVSGVPPAIPSVPSILPACILFQCDLMHSSLHTVTVWPCALEPVSCSSNSAHPSIYPASVLRLLSLCSVALGNSACQRLLVTCITSAEWDSYLHSVSSSCLVGWVRGLQPRSQQQNKLAPLAGCSDESQVGPQTLCLVPSKGPHHVRVHLARYPALQRLY